jgi:hypothetical protein
VKKKKTDETKSAKIKKPGERRRAHARTRSVDLSFGVTNPEERRRAPTRTSSGDVLLGGTERAAKEGENTRLRSRSLDAKLYFEQREKEKKNGEQTEKGEKEPRNLQRSNQTND